MDIKWKDGAVCFAVSGQWSDGDKLPEEYGNGLVTAELTQFIVASDFQLNTIKQGDYIEASELDTEQKYNDAVDEFGLFGYEKENTLRKEPCGLLKVVGGLLIATNYVGERKLTYPQLMAIGKLKRVMIERDEVLIDAVENTSILSDALNGNPSEPPNSCEGEWTDKHYNNFYQLTEEDIKAGQIKIDAYFVNRMWKINQWDDSGAGFHTLKIFPRVANNKNPLKRELVALKKQVDILCKLHGVDYDTTN